jgi:hypothetical protein
MTRSTKTTGDYEVGYGKPPVHTRFVKGRSGNPKGGSKAQGLCRAKEIVLREAYRTLVVVVKEEYGREPLPAIQAVARSQIALAAKGPAPSQRAVLAAVMAIEEERAMAAAAQKSDEIAKMSDVEVARRICFLLHLGEEELRAQRAAVPEPNAADAADELAPQDSPLADDERFVGDAAFVEDEPFAPAEPFAHNEPAAGQDSPAPRREGEESGPPDSFASLPNSLPAGNAGAAPSAPLGRNGSLPGAASVAWIEPQTEEPLHSLSHPFPFPQRIAAEKPREAVGIAQQSAIPRAAEQGKASRTLRTFPAQFADLREFRGPPHPNATVPRHRAMQDPSDQVATSA